MTSIIGMLYRVSQQVLDGNFKVAKEETIHEFFTNCHICWRCFLQDSQTCWDTLYNVLEAANCVPPYSMLEDYMREYEEDGKLNEKQLFKACSGKYTSS